MRMKSLGFRGRRQDPAIAFDEEIKELLLVTIPLRRQDQAWPRLSFALSIRLCLGEMIN